MGQGASKTPKEHLNFLLMGKTGNGKSTLGNCILGSRIFEVSASPTSCTQEIKSGYSEFQKYSLKVVDGPGLEDAELDKATDTKRAIKNINQALFECYDGLDAVLFVFRFGTRLTKEEMSAIETFKNIFGEGYFNHVIFVLTGCGQFTDLTEQENFKGSFDDWCKIQTGAFKKLYTANQKRFIFYNSFEKNKKKQITQRQQLTTLAHAMKSCNGRYTAECFRLAAIERERLIIEHNASILKEDIQRGTGILFSKIQEYIETTDKEHMAEIKLAIQNLRNEITKEDRRKELLTDLTTIISDVETSLIDKDKLLAHAMELEQTRTAKKYWQFAADIIPKLPNVKQRILAKLGIKVAVASKK